MTIKDRINAEPSLFGKILRTWVAYTLLIVTGLDQCLELINVIPNDWIPHWLKTTLVVGAVTSRVLGSLTVKKKKEEDDE